MPPRSSEEEEGRRAEEGIWDQRETSHPSSSIPCAVPCRRAAGGSPPSSPELRRQANFSNSIQIWQRSEKKEEERGAGWQGMAGRLL